MGLDMYAFSVAQGDVIDDFTIATDSEGRIDSSEVAYWRKFNALHGWMEDLYRAKGGTAESFNCKPVRLTLEDLNKLQSDMANNLLQPRNGFFFGAQEIYPEDITSTLKFIADAREAIANGRDVFYDSWW